MVGTSIMTDPEVTGISTSSNSVSSTATISLSTESDPEVGVTSWLSRDGATWPFSTTPEAATAGAWSYTGGADLTAQVLETQGRLMDSAGSAGQTQVWRVTLHLFIRGTCH